ncbi:hypothetical protein [Aneurinibacillus migulanus]|uniref:hypothetical protein n=1 Tax=Aneurinibacillus migulanus TaxID=47500 RepID=UPI0006B671C5|nr:hypothetical protein [Aneurinibacillus migulanus]
MDAPCAPAEERQTCLFPTAPAHRPSFFSSLSPQEFVDVSNQMYIVHLKYKDSGFHKFKWRNLGDLGFNKYNACILLTEIRADIEGLAAANLTDDEINISQKILKQANNGGTKEETYKRGYPSREQIIDFASRYKIFTEEVAYEILEDFCMVMKIRDSNFFIRGVIDTFKSVQQTKSI